MKAILEFNFPEDREAYHDAVNGGPYRIALDDILEAFRSKVKYQEKQETTWEEARKLIIEKIRDAGVEL